MSSAEISVEVNELGDFNAIIKIPIKAILTTQKWYYDLRKRELIKIIVDAYMNQEEMKNYFKKYIELEIKKQYGIDAEIKSMKVSDVKLENEQCIVIYNLKILEKKKKKNKDIVIDESFV